LIFRRYHELGSVRRLKDDLDRRGLVSKIRMGKHGLKLGGKAYSRGKLYKLLSNPTYKGEIRISRLATLVNTNQSSMANCGSRPNNCWPSMRSAAQPQTANQLPIRSPPNCSTSVARP